MHQQKDGKLNMQNVLSLIKKGTNHTQEVLHNFWKFSLSRNIFNCLLSSICRHWQIPCELRKRRTFRHSPNKVKNLRLNLVQGISFYCSNVQSRGIVPRAPKQSQRHLANHGRSNQHESIIIDYDTRYIGHISVTLLHHWHYIEQNYKCIES